MTEIRQLDAFDRGITRFIEGAPLIVLVLAGIGWVVWQTWRAERREWLQMLIEERGARSEMHKEILAMADRSGQAINSMRDAVVELRHAIGRVNGDRS